MLDRRTAPPIKEVGQLKLPEPTCHYLDNGTPVYLLNMGTQDIVKLEIVFKAGRPYEQKPLVGRSTASLLKDGSKTMNGHDLAERIDFLGGNLHIPANLDFTEINFYCLEKHFSALLPLLADMIKNPTFPVNELENFILRNKQRFKVDLSKTDVVAYREVTEAIYGKAHPYGYNSTPEMYDSLMRDDLLIHHERCFMPANCTIFLSGRFDSAKLLSELNFHLGKRNSGLKPAPVIPTNIPQIGGKKYIEMPDAQQTAIRIGCRLFNRSHPDYKAFHVVDTILGGYFGSRLMCNIREDKGYTYNIFSTVDTMLYDGYFYIGTEVGNEFVEKTLEEIYTEIDRLRSDLVEESELEMVRNYLLGNLLTMLDGPLNVSGIIKTMVLENLKSAEFYDLVHTIKEISPEEIRELARKHLVKENMWELVVGKIG